MNTRMMNILDLGQIYRDPDVCDARFLSPQSLLKMKSTVVHFCTLKGEKTLTGTIQVCQQWECRTTTKTVPNASLWLSNCKIFECFMTKPFNIYTKTSVQLKSISQTKKRKMSQISSKNDISSKCPPPIYFKIPHISGRGHVGYYRAKHFLCFKNSHN